MTDHPHFVQSPATQDPGRDVTAVMGRRIAAWIVDLLVFLGLSVALFALQAEYVDLSNANAAFGDACQQLQDQYGDLASGCFEVNDRAYVITSEESGVQTAASFGYLLVFILLQGIAGGSPGKLLLGLRVVKDDGSRAGVGRSFVRTLLWIVDGAPWFAPLVGFIVGLTSTGHRRVGDLVANTYVVARKDMGASVVTGAVAVPTGQPAWGAAPPPQAAAPTAPPPVPTSSWDEGPADTTAASEPPPLPDAPTPESSTPADVAAPDVGHDPEWYRGPEADPSTESQVEAPDTSQPETWSPTDPSTEWRPPTTPTPDIEQGPDASPTTSPAGFVAPGSDAPPTGPPTQPPARSLPQVSQPTPPPQWDQARNTYIQWDPNQQSWLQWDNAANRWKLIDT